MTPALAPVRWRPCWRLVPSRFPPVGLFDRVAAPDDLEAVLQIEAMTNARLRDEVGDIVLVPPGERLTGPGTTPIMAAFTHLNPQGSRFTDGSYGVYYAARELDTAIAETAFHRARFLAATGEPPVELDMRSYASDLDAPFHDIRGLQGELPDVYDPDPARYAAAQALAGALRDAGSNGIVYDSVRRETGQCVAVFRPSLLAPVRQGAHYCFGWDGREIAYIYEKRSYEPSAQ